VTSRTSSPGWLEDVTAAALRSCTNLRDPAARAAAASRADKSQFISRYATSLRAASSRST